MKQRVTVEFRTPNWQYCNLQYPGNKKYKTEDLCRFCKEYKKRGEAPRYFCTLFGCDLSSKYGSIEKTELCWTSDQIIDATEDPANVDITFTTKEVGKIVQLSIKKFKRYLISLTNEGFPLSEAITTASNKILDEWK